MSAECKKIAEQAKELEAKDQAVNEQVAKQLKAERKKIAEEEKTKILAEYSEQKDALKGELEEKRKQLSEANTLSPLDLGAVMLLKKCKV